jgi:hypothetical protein
VKGTTASSAKNVMVVTLCKRLLRCLKQESEYTQPWTAWDVTDCRIRVYLAAVITTIPIVHTVFS